MKRPNLVGIDHPSIIGGEGERGDLRLVRRTPKGFSLSRSAAGFSFTLHPLPFTLAIDASPDPFMASKAHLLIVDDDANTLASLARAFRLAGYGATVCDSAGRALELAKSERFDLILSDVVMPGKDGLSLLEDLKTAGVAAPVVMVSGQAHIEMAIKATRLGAVDFLEKPLSTDKLLLTVENALRLTRLEQENRRLRERLGKHEIVWTGESMRDLMAQIGRVAASETRVCILGETGTGKELVARALHESSARRG